MQGFWEDLACRDWLLLHRPVVCMMGGPGAGKGHLGSGLGLPHVSSGELLRRERRMGTAIGEEAAPFLQDGQLVPDRLVKLVVRGEIDRLMQAGALTYGVVLDGIPRKALQLSWVTEFVRQGRFGSCFYVWVQCDPNVALARASKRAEDRDDKDTQALESKMEEWDYHAPSFLPECRRTGRLIEIDGTLCPEVNAKTLLAEMQSRARAEVFSLPAAW